MITERRLMTINRKLPPPMLNQATTGRRNFYYALAVMLELLYMKIVSCIFLRFLSEKRKDAQTVQQRQIACVCNKMRLNERV